MAHEAEASIGRLVADEDGHEQELHHPEAPAADRGAQPTQDKSDLVGVVIAVVAHG